MATVRDYDVVIVGAGPAGMTAALYTGRAMLKTAVLERGFPGGELLNTEYLDDVIGFPRSWYMSWRKNSPLTPSSSAPSSSDDQRDIGDEMPDGHFHTEVETGDIFRSPAVIVMIGRRPISSGFEASSSTRVRECRTARSVTRHSSSSRSWRWSAAAMPHARKPIS